MSAEIFEELSSSLINLDERRYISALSSLTIPLIFLHTPEHNNSNPHSVLHELSLSIAREDHLLGFFTQIVLYLLSIPSDSSESPLKALLNQQNLDGKTPLHLGIMTGRKVKFI